MNDGTEKFGWWPKKNGGTIAKDGGTNGWWPTPGVPPETKKPTGR